MTHNATKDTKKGDVIDVAVPCRVIAGPSDDNGKVILVATPLHPPSAQITVIVDPTTGEAKEGGE